MDRILDRKLSMSDKELTFLLDKGKYIAYSFYADDGRVRGGIGHSCDADIWAEGNLPKKTKNLLGRLRLIIDKYVSRQQIALEPILKAEIVALIDKELGREKNTDRKKNTVKELYAEYLQKAKSGEITNRGRKLGESAILILNAMISHMEKWPGYNKPMSALDREDIESLQNILIAKNRSQNTLNTYINRFVIFGRTTLRLKWHKNTLFAEDGLFVPPDEIDYAIYYNQKELEHLYGFDLPDWLIVDRDWFVLGCQLGLRWSDLSTTSPLNVGEQYYSTEQEKTEKPVYIPINNLAREILDKYGNTFPGGLNYATFRYRIKKICKLAGFTTLKFSSRIQGGVKVEEWLPKHDMTGTHTMRRSFATNAYLAGVPIDLIMAITGHKTVKSFMKYIRISLQEKAELAAKHAFFK